MPQSHSDHSPNPFVDFPVCPKCGALMQLARIEPDTPGRASSNVLTVPHRKLSRSSTDRALMLSLAERRAIAEGHVRDGRRIVARQKEIIALQQQQHRSTDLSEELLAQFERSQAIFESDLQRLLVQGK